MRSHKPDNLLRWDLLCVTNCVCNRISYFLLICAISYLQNNSSFAKVLSANFGYEQNNFKKICPDKSYGLSLFCINTYLCSEKIQKQLSRSQQNYCHEFQCFYIISLVCTIIMKKYLIALVCTVCACVHIELIQIILLNMFIKL